MLSIIGLFVILTIVIMLLSGKVLPNVAMTIIPIIGALLAGFSFHDIGIFFNSGFNTVIHIAIMFIFAILYFGIMQDVGLFTPLVKFVVRFAGGSAITISLGTVIIAAVAHLEGSGAATFLITIPLLLPIYKELKMSPYLLVLLIGASASIMNMIPWAGPVGRISSVINVSPIAFWYPLIQIQVLGILFLLVLTVFLAVREKKRIANGYNLRNNLSPVQDATIADKQKIVEINPYVLRKNMYMFNLLLTFILITSLVIGEIPPELSFIIALAIALPANFTNIHDRIERIYAHSSGALMMALIIISAGVFLGVLGDSGMLRALSNSIIHILPDGILSHITTIVSIFGVPLELVLNTDAYYFALLPLVSEISNTYSVSPEATSYMMLVGNVAGTFISPFSPALWLAVGLAGIDIGKYIKYSILWIWLISLFLLACTKILILQV
ncbi:citrate:proton symporter [Francisellaceae bacterium CB299]|jgi:CitMHS family citrate-Mg2+:H+ or citrate-Ca2+:H+ symporter